jgi:hypothetical protein
MRYYYIDPFHQTAGPVEATALYEAYTAGTMPGGTLLALEGTDTWRPLEDQLPFFYSYSGDARGPLTLRQIQAFSVNAPEPILVAMPGGGEWFPLARLPITTTLPPHQAAPLVPPPLPSNHYAPAAARRGRRSPPTRRTPVPVGVRIAGGIWIGYGVLRLILAASVLLRSLVNPVAAFLALIIAALPVLLGIAFIVIGNKTMRGQVPDVLGNGIGSIGAGILMSFMAYRLVPPEAGFALVVEGAINLCLIIAGLVALENRKRFLAWKRQHMPGYPGPSLPP